MGPAEVMNRTRGYQMIVNRVWSHILCTKCTSQRPAAGYCQHPYGHLPSTRQPFAQLASSRRGQTGRRNRTKRQSAAKSYAGLDTLRVIHSPDLPEDWNNTAVLIDKPLDWTSFDVCAKLRNRVQMKAGHAGTLDPAATGLLIVCLGKGTKSVDYFQGQDKEYMGTLCLGEETSSYDAQTPVIRTASWEHLTLETIKDCAKSFQGDILQVPPMYSAIRKNGVRMYERARKGEKVKMDPRQISVEKFEVWRESEENPQILNFHVKCSKGTYIRSLVYDLGIKLGSAAHMTTLRRTAIGEHKIDKAWDLQELVQQLESRME